MNRLFSLFVLLLTAPAVYAQSCDAMREFFTPGITLEYANFDRKGKSEGTYTHRVNKIENSGDTVITRIAMTTFDKKGKEQFQNEFAMKCHKGTIFLDSRNFLPPSAMSAESSPNISISIKGDDLVFPSAMWVGQTLPDSETEVVASMNGLQLFTTGMKMYNRKVEAEEKVTTPAGEFKCLKITYDMDLKSMGSRTMHCNYWYADGVGMVKSETLDKKGSLDSRTELVKVVK